ncbi:hypothetical protein FKP32DRAFT_1586642 [Trametes sanguinea]|nr:hypothetical protein FKP32DRAFT_1586642 [Trametes sanguinea]
MALWDALESAIDAPPSPTIPSIMHPAQKRKRSDLAGSSQDSSGSDTDHDGDDGNSPFRAPVPSSSPESEAVLSPPINANLIALAMRVGSAKRLRGEHQQELEVFASDALRVQNIKLFAELKSVSSRLEKIVNTSPAYQVSESLAKNIYSYALGVMFSSKLAAYKGTVPLNHVLDIVKCFRFDIPKGIEHNPADWAKIVGEAQDALTQIRSKIKKALRASLKPDNSADHQNIYNLTQELIAKSSCKVTIQLCARVALMRAVYMEDPSGRYWNSVDDYLSKIRTHADTPEKLVRAFKHILNEDRKEHGAAAECTFSHEYGDDEFQQRVDNTIVGASAAAPTYAPVPAHAAPLAALGMDAPPAGYSELPSATSSARSGTTTPRSGAATGAGPGEAALV